MKKSYIKPRMRVIDSPELLYNTDGLGVHSGYGTYELSKRGMFYEEEEEQESWCEDPRLVTGFEVPGL